MTGGGFTTTRRAVLAGALAVPTVAGLASWRWKHGSSSALLHDDTLQAGRRFAEAGNAAGARTIAIEGDAVRFAQSITAQSPSLIVGVSRHAEALLIAEVAAEAGYMMATELRGNAQGCQGYTCDAGWFALNRMAVGAGSNWIEALAAWAANPNARDVPTLSRSSGRQTGDPGTVLGWVLVPRG